jgi:hypothetical protein
MEVRSAPSVSQFPEESAAALAAAEDREFIQRLDGLSRALSDFAKTYKSGQVDLKKVKMLRKAMQDLEKSEWFKPPRAK